MGGNGVSSLQILATVMSAIAALGSLITAILSYRLNRENFLESIQPRISVGFAPIIRKDNSLTIPFSSISNKGKDRATDVTIKLATDVSNDGRTKIECHSVRVLNPGTAREFKGKIEHTWSECEKTSDGNFNAEVYFVAHFKDKKGTCYEQFMGFFLSSDRSKTTRDDQIFTEHNSELFATALSIDHFSLTRKTFWQNYKEFLEKNR